MVKVKGQCDPFHHGGDEIHNFMDYLLVSVARCLKCLISFGIADSLGALINIIIHSIVAHTLAQFHIKLFNEPFLFNDGLFLFNSERCSLVVSCHCSYVSKKVFMMTLVCILLGSVWGSQKTSHQIGWKPWHNFSAFKKSTRQFIKDWKCTKSFFQNERKTCRGIAESTGKIVDIVPNTKTRAIFLWSSCLILDL